MTTPLAAPEVAIARPETAATPDLGGTFSCYCLLHVNRYSK